MAFIIDMYQESGNTCETFGSGPPSLFSDIYQNILPMVSFKKLPTFPGGSTYTTGV